MRSPPDYGGSDLLLGCLVNGGLVGACECLSRWLPVDKEGPLKSCIFWGRLSAKRHAFHPKLTVYPHQIKSTCRCHCPDIRLSDLERNTTTTVFCISRSSQISSRVSYSPYEFFSAHCFLLQKHPEICTRK